MLFSMYIRSIQGYRQKEYNMLFSMYIRSIQGYRQKEYNMLFSMYIRSIQGYRHRNICYLVCRKVVFRDIDRGIYVI